MWIARDENGKIFIFDKKPQKKVSEWWAGWGHHKVVDVLVSDIFYDVKWEDEEPKVILLCW